MAADPTIPSFVVDSEQRIDLNISQTNAVVTSQGYTYNQATLTYNQAGVKYGGIQGVNQDIAPNFFNDTATLLVPSISGIIDVGAIFEGGARGQSVGPGFFLYITHD